MVESNTFNLSVLRDSAFGMVHFTRCLPSSYTRKTNEKKNLNKKNIILILLESIVSHSLIEFAKPN
jgi:hypothetical protein